MNQQTQQSSDNPYIQKNRGLLAANNVQDQVLDKQNRQLAEKDAIMQQIQQEQQLALAMQQAPNQGGLNGFSPREVPQQVDPGLGNIGLG